MRKHYRQRWKHNLDNYLGRLSKLEKIDRILKEEYIPYLREELYWKSMNFPEKWLKIKEVI